MCIQKNIDSLYFLIWKDIDLTENAMMFKITSALQTQFEVCLRNKGIPEKTYGVVYKMAVLLSGFLPEI